MSVERDPTGLFLSRTFQRMNRVGSGGMNNAPTHTHAHYND